MRFTLPHHADFAARDRGLPRCTIVQATARRDLHLCRRREKLRALVGDSDGWRSIDGPSSRGDERRQDVARQQRLVGDVIEDLRASTGLTRLPFVTSLRQMAVHIVYSICYPESVTALSAQRHRGGIRPQDLFPRVAPRHACPRFLDCPRQSLIPPASRRPRRPRALGCSARSAISALDARLSVSADRCAPWWT